MATFFMWLGIVVAAGVGVYLLFALAWLAFMFYLFKDM